MRTIIIGDIHGSYQSLKSGLEKISFNITEDRLICLGDYVDGWKDSAKVLRLLIDIQTESKFNNIFLLGNHDAWLIEVLNNDFDQFRDEFFIHLKYKHWIRHGGQATYKSFLKLTDDEIYFLKENFLDKLKTHHIENDKLFVHAGFDPEIGFEETVLNDPESLYWNRSLFQGVIECYNDKNPETEYYYDKIMNGFSKIYLGHTPTTVFNIPEPININNVINLDQGCKLNGRLTFWVDETDTYIQTEELKK